MAISPLPCIIGANHVVLALSKRYGVKLALNDLVLMYFIKDYNDRFVRCGGVDVLSAFSLNGRRHSSNDFSDRLGPLVACGYLTCRSGRIPWSSLNLRITAPGIAVLADFERLLLSYKV